MTVTASESELEQFRLQFAREHYFILPRLIEPELLDRIARRVEAAPYRLFDDNGIAVEDRMDDPVSVNLLDFLINRPEFLERLRTPLGLRNLGLFKGRVYRMSSNGEHHDHWHDDCVHRRVATLSLNLTREEFRGGALQIRQRSSRTLSQEIRNTGFGDALIFRISRKLCHRVTAVEGEVPKIAYSGWFRWGNGYHERIRQLAEAQAARSGEAPAGEA